MNKYETSSLKNSELKQNKEKLIHLMEGQKPYLNPSLSLSDLANKISIPHRQLSQVINESFNQNFYDFVNTYRITECKRLLNHCSDEKKTIIEIAFEVGFNSKSTFNKAFKKHTGLTPKEYKKVRIDP
ncbi:MAG: helix-turn-helix domain-containing protein [bacterium]